MSDILAQYWPILSIVFGALAICFFVSKCSIKMEVGGVFGVSILLIIGLLGWWLYNGFGF